MRRAKKTHYGKTAPKVRNQRKKSKDFLASSNLKKSLTIFSGVLYFAGHPVYYILSRVLLAITFILYTTGHFTKYLIDLFFKLGVQILQKSHSLSLRLGRFLPKKVRTRHLFLIASFLLFVVSPALLLIFIFRGLPSPTQLSDRNIDVSTKIYDRNGTILYTIYRDKNRTIIPLSKIPLEARLATLAAEDAEFYSHPGFSIKGIARSIIKNASRGEISGGSTITQQLVKNALLTPEKTLTRKIKEIVLALLVETKYTKNQILEMYLNEVGYGGAAYGIEEAAQTYFGKSVNKLTLSEAALLAGLPKSPTTYSPYGTNPALAIEREKEVLHLMQVNGFITKDQENEALKQKPVFVPNKTDIKAPHFVMYVRQILEDIYGKSVVEKGGLEVTTTLDYNIQKLAEKVVSQEIDKLKGLNVTNAAVVILNPKTGEILAMVGSKDYFDTGKDGNVNVVISPRQPGSSIKIVNYSYALSNGYSPATILSDSPISFNIKGQTPYIPKNYDGTFKGNLSLREAFAQSRNVPAVKVLASYGVDKMIDMGQKMGITTWNNRSRFGLSLTLGGGEVTLLDLARVYATVANGGIRPQIQTFLSVKDYKGDDLFPSKKDCIISLEGTGCGEKVLDPRVAFMITDILKDNSARAPAFGHSSYLVIPNHPEVAVKTGTSNNLRDNLTVGYNQDYLVAVWVGNNDNSPMARIASGITGASPIWNRIFSALLANTASKNWGVPAGISQIPICTLTGTLPCQGCPIRLEWFLDENKPKYACNSQLVEKITQEKAQGIN